MGNHDTEGQVYLCADFPLCRGAGTPNLHVVERSTVIAQGRLSRQRYNMIKTLEA